MSGRILIAWELGANLGHLLRELPIARALRRRSHSVTFACRDLTSATATAGAQGFACVQAPVVRQRRERLPEPNCYADLLAGCGFGDRQTLEAAVTGWCGLIDLARPDALIADHAPLAQFAARLCGVPVMQIGTGFELPPTTRPLPSLKPWQPLTEADRLAREERLLDPINHLCARHGARPFAQLADLYESQAPVLATWPELDPFERPEGTDYFGPLFSQEDGPAVEWPEAERTSPRVFAYLRDPATLPATLQALAQSSARVIAALPGAAPDLLRQHQSERMRLYPHPVNAAIVRQADLVLTHGGHGLSAAALEAGVPLLLLPRTLEQWLLTRRVADMGAGLGITPEQAAPRMAQALEALLREPRWRNAAQAFASRHDTSSLPAAPERIADRIESLYRPSRHQEREPALRVAT